MNNIQSDITHHTLTLSSTGLSVSTKNLLFSSLFFVLLIFHKHKLMYKLWCEAGLLTVRGQRSSVGMDWCRLELNLTSLFIFSLLWLPGQYVFILFTFIWTHTIISGISLFCSPKLHLFDQKCSKNCEILF